MKRLIVDVSSLLWTCLMAGKDEEFGRKVEHNGKMVQVNSAQHGFDNALNALMAALRKLSIPMTNVILVVEGEFSKALRKQWLPTYNQAREQKSYRAPDNYVEFNLLKERILHTLRYLGAQAVTQAGVEADDVIAALCTHLQGEKFIHSNDGDLAVLVNDSTHIWKDGNLDQNPYGEFPHKFITLYKALVGDTADSIPGAKGFGKGAFTDLCVTFGLPGLELLDGLVREKQLDKLVEDVGELKVLQKIIDSADTVYACYEAAKLHPEMVDRLRRPLEWTAGMVNTKQVECDDERLRPFAASLRLITANNFESALAFFRDHLGTSPIVSLDIESSVPREADEWLEKLKGGEDDDRVGIDVLGSEITGFSVTFGGNSQYTYYVCINHARTENITKAQAVAMITSIPEATEIVVHNFAFEGPVLRNSLDSLSDENGLWGGFLANVVDTRILSRYTDENQSAGLKKLSKANLDYEQQTYDETVCREYREGDARLPGGMVVGTRTTESGETLTKVEYKMDELSGEDVLYYGADDAIVTAALYHHFRIRMEFEGTWEIMKEVEIFPQYLNNERFLQGWDISLETMFDLEAEDDKLHAKAWETIRAFLIQRGWEGTVCPVVGETLQLDPAGIKFLVNLLLGLELKTQVRTPEKLIKLVECLPHDDAPLLAHYLTEGNTAQLNDWVKRSFKGEPILDTDSPKVMRHFLYDVVGAPISIVNKVTALERTKKPDLAAAVGKFKRIQAGSGSEELTEAELSLLKAKAKVDETAMKWAIAFDADKVPVDVLKAVLAMKTVETRRKLYYKPYRNLPHWKTGKFHSSIAMSAQVTLRNTSSGPNLTQVPKLGEGVKVRRIYQAHHQDAVVVSLDFSGQELRLGADRSQDPNMLACFIGDKKKDMHSLTASGAMRKKWGNEYVDEMEHRFAQPHGSLEAYELFCILRKSEDEAVAKKADDLRKNAKNVNFGAQYDAQAPRLAETLIISVADSQTFLDAKYAMFPRFEVWKEEVKRFVKTNGYTTTVLGARRHLRNAVLSEDKWEAEKAGRQGPNFEIQGSGAEQTKLAMGRMWKLGLTRRYDAKFLAPVHDEVVWSCAVADLIPFLRELHGAMVARYGDMSVPIVSSISIGRNFCDQIECGDEVDEQVIRGALKEIGFEEALV